MPLRRWAPIVLALVVALVGLTGTPAAAAINRTYSYENGFNGWQLGYAGDGEWSMTRTTEVSFAGRYSVACYLDGASGTGTAWLARSYPAPMDTLVQLKLTFELWSPEQSSVNQWEVLGYVGTGPPTSKADFEVIGYTDMVAGWQQYRFERLQLTGQWPARIYVAFGMSSTWEYAREYYFDYAKVTLTP
jgi:hypothetical protein